MNDQSPDQKIEHRLEELKEIPSRNPQHAARGRANFLSEAAKYRQAVSLPLNARQKGWTFLKYRKERFAMNALVSLILAGALILGGGATAVAAQDDLPNQPLYPVKLMVENAKMALTGNPQEQAYLLMNMAQTRVEEMAGLVDQGIPVPAQVQERLQQQIQQTMMLAVGMDDDDLTQTLLQLRERLRAQERTMTQLQTNATTETEPLLTQTRQMLQDCLRLVDEGIGNPQSFRYRMTNQMQYGQDEDAIPEPNQQGEPGFHQNDQGGQPPIEPGSGSGGENGDGNGHGDDQNSDKGGNGQNGSGNDTSGGQNGNGSGSGGNGDSGSESGGNGSGSGDSGGDGSGSGGNGGGGSGGSGGNK